jgi:hypothetical protein
LKEISGVLEVKSRQSQQHRLADEIPPYMTSKLRALYTIMREIQDLDNYKDVVSKVKELTGYTDPRDVSAIVALINRKPKNKLDGSNRWPSED